MSPKATAVLVLMLTVVFAVGPHLPELVAGSGMIVAPWIKLLGALLAACGAIVMAQLPAIKVLARADGTASIGGQGVTLGGAPSKPPPPIPRPGQGGHARLRALLLLDAVAFVGILVAAIFVSHVLNDSRPRTASPAGCSGAPRTGSRACASRRCHGSRPSPASAPTAPT